MSLPPSEVPQGAIRFNTDSQKLEFYAQGEWWVMSTDTPNLGTSGDSTPGTRGLFAGGNASTPVGDRIEYINIASTGNAIDFGNLVKQRQESSGLSNRTRALWGGDAVPSAEKYIDVVTIASTGNASDYGDLLTATDNTQSFGTCANATRGLWAGGYDVPAGRLNIIQYCTIDTNGNTIDFGDLTAVQSGPAGAASPTRGLFMAGTSPGSTNTITFVTISTLGNSQDFGGLTFTDHSGGASSNAVRALYFQSNNSAIDYLTIATLGNAQDFGDLTSATNHYSGGSPSSSTRACYGGGGYPSTTDVIDYVQIMTTGNSVDFGNLTSARNLMMRGNCSNGHGGL